MIDELILSTADGLTSKVDLSSDRFTVGRATENDLSYPQDGELSRRHLAFQRNAGKWVVSDLGSRNGTRLNGVRISGSASLKSGDRVKAGKLTMEYCCANATMDRTAALDDNVESQDALNQAGWIPTVITSLDKALGNAASFGAQNASRQSTGSQMRALIDAGRELADHRPLAELFPLILDLAAKAVGGSRGVLMLQERDALVVRASMGGYFEISKAVRERVLQHKESLLIADAQLDDKLRLQESIVAQSIRSIIAVPLQAKAKVIGLIYLDSHNLARPFTSEDLGLLTVMANIAAIRIENARLTEVEEHEHLMAHEMAQAAEIQRSLLPQSIPQQPGLVLAAFSESCLSVGGDHYEFYERDGKLILLIADVAGKGMPAALLAASLQARIQVLMEEETDLAALVARLNRVVASNCPGNRFITFFICEVDPSSGALEFVNAGHNPPLLVRSSGGVQRLDGGGMVLGIFPRAAYTVQTAHLDEGDLLVMFSDGVTEAEDPTVEEEFGEVRLVQALEAFKDRPPAEIIEQIKNAVKSFAGSVPAADDFTLVLASKTRRADL